MVDLLPGGFEVDLAARASSPSGARSPARGDDLVARVRRRARGPRRLLRLGRRAARSGSSTASSRRNRGTFVACRRCCRGPVRPRARRAAGRAAADPRRRLSGAARARRRARRRALALALGSRCGSRRRRCSRNRAGMSQVVLARDGLAAAALARRATSTTALWTPLDEIPPALVEATLLQEDRCFYWHPGVNPASLLRARRPHLPARDRARRRLDAHDAARAPALRARHAHAGAASSCRCCARSSSSCCYSKREILEAYLNLAPYGGNVEGAGAASWVWFGKPVAELTPAEALALAVIPQEPGRARTREQPTAARAIAAARARSLSAWHARQRRRSRRGRRARRRSRAHARALPVPRAAPGRARCSPSSRRRAHRDAPSIPRCRRWSSARSRASPSARSRYGLRNAAVLLVDSPHACEVLAYVGSADSRDAAIQGAGRRRARAALAGLGAEAVPLRARARRRA